MKEICESNQSAEVKNIFGLFTMETILATSFGRQVNLFKGEGNELTQAVAGVITNFDLKLVAWSKTIFCKKADILRYD
jgi:hypothetical protein